jgi:hypothetical protein
MAAGIQVVAARGGLGLALVLAAEPPGAVRMIGGRRQREERELGDAHAGVDRDRQIGHVGQLERDVAVEAGVDHARGLVDHQPQPAQRALAVKRGNDVVG